MKPWFRYGGIPVASCLAMCLHLAVVGYVRGVYAPLTLTSLIPPGLLVLFNILYLAGVRTARRNRRRQAELEAQREQLRHIAALDRSALERDRMRYRTCHDWKNHLIVLQGMLEEKADGDAADYLQRLRGELEVEERV